MGHVAAGTIVAKSYLSFARVLARSFQEHHPEVPFFVLLADEVDGWFDPAAEPFHLLRLSDLGIPRLERFRFHYTQQPLSYAATPWLLSHLLDQGFDSVAFFKQESLVLGDHTPSFEKLETCSIVLTPHLLAPVGPERELNILLSGVFNIGLLGVSEKAREFLTWWQDRVFAHCRHDVAKGMHWEQRWIDLVPALFEDVCILRDPGANVGHWNLPERDSLSCRLLRFSGFSPDDPMAPTKYSTRLTMADLGPAAALFDRYRTLLEESGYHETRIWPYAYGSFDNGVAVPDLARRMYLDLGEEAAAFGDPLQSGSPNSYFQWLNQPVDPSSAITRLWQAIYHERPDVQSAFPDLLGSDSEAFRNWAAHFGIREHGIPEAFIP
ncbi:MAG TPA: hypothetical protein VF179_31515 [Thermoanaerobaculia bacterium]|nr:hypothetical protein [Thermoanaerobaculia bacterium]